MFSKAPNNQIAFLGNLLSDAVQTSHHWEMERTLGEDTTDCLTTMIPENRNQDISLTLWVGLEAGLRLNDILKPAGTRLFPTSVVFLCSQYDVVLSAALGSYTVICVPLHVIHLSWSTPSNR